MKKRILIASLYHETHTFLENTTMLRDFSIIRGDELLSDLSSESLWGAVVEFSGKVDWELLPVADMRADPAGMVADEVVEYFWNQFQDVAKQELATGIDGIYLILHGAMVSNSIDDVEGEILTRIRRLNGFENIPICGVVDLHANFSRRMAKQSQGLIAYRQNPHTDAHLAALDGARLLDRILKWGEKPVTVWLHSSLMWPPTGTATNDKPMRQLEEIARRIERENSDILFINVLAGFAMADTAETGVSFTAVTLGSEIKAIEALEELKNYTWANRHNGYVVSPTVEKILPELQDKDHGPIIIVEPSDNIGAGAPGDGTGVLRALIINHHIKNALCVINDPEAVKNISVINIGDHKKLTLGGRGSNLDSGPVELNVELVATSNGCFEVEDKHSHLVSMLGSTLVDMGPSAVVRCRNVTILLTSRKTPPFDLGQLRSQGLEPEKFNIIVVKAAVAHKRAYDPITVESYTVETPGPCSSRLTEFPYNKINRPIWPLDEI
ncbi:MAG: M81 family metallopeptidase [Sedimentisphaerales bacterium]|nr:M81 family metallopeptidase [Sedimentisphaerales bacterium]